MMMLKKYYKNYQNKIIILFGFFVFIIFQLFCISRGSAQTDSEVDTLLAYQYYLTADSLTLLESYDSAIMYFQKASNIYRDANCTIRDIECQNEIVWIYNQQGQYKEALSCAKNILSQDIEDNETRLTTYLYFGIALLNQGIYDSSLFYLQKARLSKQKVNTYEVYLGMGALYHRLGKYDSALIYSHEALNIQEDTYGKYSKETVKPLSNIGSSYLMTGKNDLAVKYFQNALLTLNNNPNPEALTIAVLNANIGQVYLGQDRLDSAMEYFVKITRLKLDQHPIIADIYSNIGDVFKRRGYYDSAILYHQRALSLKKKTIGSDQARMTPVYSGLGSSYLMRGDYELAAEYYQKALDVEINKSKESHVVAILYTNMAIVYSNQAKYDMALRCDSMALAINKKLLGEENKYVANIYSHIGILYEHKKTYNTALAHYDKALAIHRKISDKSNFDIATTMMSKGIVHGKKGNHRMGIEYCTKALDIFQNLYGLHHPKVVGYYNEIGDIYLQWRKYNLALDNYQRSLELNKYHNATLTNNTDLQKVLDAIQFLHAIESKAEVFSKIYQQTGNINKLVSALEAYQTSDSVIQLIRQSYKNYSDKVTINKRAQGIYERAISTCLMLYKVTKEQNYLTLAYYFMERNKMGTLAEALSDLSAKSFGSIPDNLLALEKSLRVDQSFYRTQLQQEQTQPENYDTSKVQDYQNKLFTTNRRYDSLIAALEQQYPGYYQLKYQSDVIGLKKLQALLLDSTTMLSYFSGDSATYIFAVNRNEVAVTTVSDTVLNSRVNQYRKLLSTRSEDDSQLMTLAYQIYDSLVGKPLNRLGNTHIRKLIVVPDGPMGYLPFETLLTQPSDDAKVTSRQLPYLLKKYIVSYAYSATLLFQKTPIPTPSALNNYIAFAPVYPVAQDQIDTVYQAKLGRLRDQITSLVWNQQEAKQLDQYLAGMHYTGSTATEAQFKQEAHQYGIIHLAMHALVDDKQPMNSKLVFTTTSDSTEDGLLHAYEIYNMEIPAQLVTLSACNTGFGKLERGEGIMSIARAFAYAGCASLAVSHWAVDDKATATLMSYFYRYLSEGLPKDEALHQAKLTFLEEADQQARHPFYWGAFVLVGNTSPITSPKAQWHWLWYAGSGLLLLILLTWVGQRWPQR